MMMSHVRCAVLLGMACLLAACEPGSNGTGPDPVPPPTTPPAPIVVREGALFIRSAGSTSGAKFQLGTAGRLQVNLEWTPTGTETDLFVRVLWRTYEGECNPSCEAEDLCLSHCRRLMESWGDVTTRRTSLTTVAALPPDNYELWISYYDPLDYLIPIFPGSPPRVSISYQILLLPTR